MARWKDISMSLILLYYFRSSIKKCVMMDANNIVAANQFISIVNLSFLKANPFIYRILDVTLLGLG